jgi:hypothetical protein
VSLENAVACFRIKHECEALNWGRSMPYAYRGSALNEYRDRLLRPWRDHLLSDRGQ